MVCSKALTRTEQEFRRFRSLKSQRFSIAATRNFLRRPDVLDHPLWAKMFDGRTPPWSEISRIAAFVKVELHPNALAWGFDEPDAYIAKLEKLEAWFLPGVSAYRWRRVPRELVDEDEVFV